MAELNAGAGEDLAVSCTVAASPTANGRGNVIAVKIEPRRSPKRKRPRTTPPDEPPAVAAVTTTSASRDSLPSLLPRDAFSALQHVIEDRVSSSTVPPATPTLWSVQIRKVGWTAEEARSLLVVPIGTLSQPLCRALLKMDLEGNRIGDDGMRYVCDALRRGHLSRLTHLLLASNMITNNGINLLADALSARPDVNGCAGEVDRLNEDGHHPSCLSVIGLSNNPLSDLATESLVEIVRRCGKRLQRLFVHHADLTCATMRLVLTTVDEAAPVCNGVFAGQNKCSSDDYNCLKKTFPKLMI